MPTELYAHAPEILEHCDRIGKQYGLQDNALFHTEVTGLEWDAARSRWIVRTDRGDEFTAQFVGDGHRAAARAEAARHPRHRVRSAATRSTPAGGTTPTPAATRPARRWIGSPTSAWPSSAPARRRCSASRTWRGVPGAVRLPAHAVVGGRARQPADGSATGSPAWPRQAGRSAGCDNFVANMSAGELPDEDLVNDGWTDLAKRIRGRLSAPRPGPASFDDLLADFENADHEKMSEIRARVDAIVDGSGHGAHALKAWYRQLCKRPCFHDEYLERFQPAVGAPDRHRRQGSGADHPGRRGRGRHRVPGRLHHLRLGLRGRHRADPALRVRPDRPRRRPAVGVLVGRDAQPARRPRARLPERVPGPARPGRQLRGQRAAQPERRGQDRRRASSPHDASSGFAEVEVSPDAEDAWMEQLAPNPVMASFLADCTPGYYNNEGQGPSPHSLLVGYSARGARVLPLHRAVAQLGRLRGPGVRPGRGRGRSRRRSRGRDRASAPGSIPLADPNALTRREPATVARLPLRRLRVPFPLAAARHPPSAGARVPGHRLFEITGRACSTGAPGMEIR